MNNVRDYIATFNENDLLLMLVAVESYTLQNPESYNIKATKDALNKFNTIWDKLKSDEDYIIFGEPF